MIESFFNLCFIVILWRFLGEFHKASSFDPLFQKIKRITDPLYVWLQKGLPSFLAPYAFFIVLAGFFFLRSLHYYSYGHDFLSLAWGPALLFFGNASLKTALVKSFVVTGIFYFQVVSTLLFFRRISRIEEIGDPYWRTLSYLTAWIQNLLLRRLNAKGKTASFFLLFGISLFFFSVLIYLLLWMFHANVFIGAHVAAGALNILKVLVLNLHEATACFYVLLYALLIRAFLSWFFLLSGRGLVEFLYKLTDPFVGWFSRLNFHMGAVDFSILFASLFVFVLCQITRGMLLQLYALL